jgi:tetratricopeptide (TPR) repeat protein
MTKARHLSCILLAAIFGGLAGRAEAASHPNANSFSSSQRSVVATPGPGDDDETAPSTGEDSPGAKTRPAPVLTSRQKLDDLFARLAASTDVAETQGLVAAIDRLQLESGSSTGDLLMARAVAALGANNLPIAIELLDKLIVLQPGWAEAWNKRATVRYLMGEDQRSMADIAQTLALEPRHFGALAGMGMILERRGFRDDALRAYRRALEVAPQLESVKSAVDRLQAAVDGQSL